MENEELKTETVKENATHNIEINVEDPEKTAWEMKKKY